MGAGVAIREAQYSRISLPCVANPCIGVLLTCHKYEYDVGLPYNDGLMRSINRLL